MTRVLQTRQVGLTTHVSGHVMAPPDIVYEVESRPRSPLWARILIPACILFLAYGFVSAIVHALTGVTI